MSIYEELIEKKVKLSLIGLGYVGMPIAIAFAKNLDVIGYDVNREKIELYKSGVDPTKEVGNDEIKSTTVHFTADETELRKAKFHIIAVPTPVSKDHTPDLSPVEGASRLLGQNLTKGSVVVYESTVYPGVTEDICVPILEKESGLKCGVDFKIGYSPERINPGDREHTVRNICKIVSGSTPEAAERINRVYSSVLTGGTHLASSIKVAEAAKIIENTQRDVNIAFINEVTKVLNSLNINTDRVLEAASTKWNFLKFHPGLVGGHCISVDPYYLIRQAERHGEHPHLMKEARRINESMGFYLAENVVKTIRERGKEPSEMRILVLGFSFKANCPDIRNTKVYDTIMRLLEYTPHVIAYDPVVNIDTVRHEYGDVPVSTDFKEIVAAGSFDVVVRCVNHSCFSRLDLRSVTRRGFIEQAIVNPDL